MEERETQQDVELVALDEVERWAIARAEHREWLAAQPGRLERVRQRRAERRRARADRRHHRREAHAALGRGPRLVARLLLLDRPRRVSRPTGGTPAWTASAPLHVLVRPRPADSADPTNRQGADG